MKSGRNRTKCIWCGRPCQNGFCSPGCSEKYAGYEKLADRCGGLFLIGCLTPVILVIPAVIFADSSKLWIGLILLIVAVTMIALPFATRETVEAWGVRKSKIAMRIIGLVFIAAGAALILSVLLRIPSPAGGKRSPAHPFPLYKNASYQKVGISWTIHFSE